jgi:hypothetical protein
MTARGLVTVAVQGVDDLPVATDDAATLAQNAPATPIEVRANDPDPDGDPGTIASVGEPEHGTTSIAGGVPRSPTSPIRTTPTTEKLSTASRTRSTAAPRPR